MGQYVDIETGVLPAGQPFTRIGSGSHLVLSLPGLPFIPEASTPRAAARLWRTWLDPITRHDLTVFDVGRPPDIPTGSTAADVADADAAVIRSEWGRAVGVVGFSSIAVARHIDYPNAGHGRPGRFFAEAACAFLAGR